jgi:hypothetical protein
MHEKLLPPMICIKGPKGQIFSPKLEKGPDGNWQISKPEEIKRMLGMDEKTPDKK